MLLPSPVPRRIAGNSDIGNEYHSLFPRAPRYSVFQQLLAFLSFIRRLLGILTASQEVDRNVIEAMAMVKIEDRRRRRVYQNLFLFSFMKFVLQHELLSLEI